MQRAPTPRADSVRREPPGPVVFARYAYGPNRLGLCGPDDAEALFGQTSRGSDERELRELALGFEGAYPYLELIARAKMFDEDFIVVDTESRVAVKPVELGEEEAVYRALVLGLRPVGDEQAVRRPPAVVGKRVDRHVLAREDFADC